jgi:predicted 2-oxoglutarate/Fe(II)-dependent dioxygenase YbiX
MSYTEGNNVNNHRAESKSTKKGKPRQLVHQDISCTLVNDNVMCYIRGNNIINPPYTVCFVKYIDR